MKPTYLTLVIRTYTTLRDYIRRGSTYVRAKNTCSSCFAYTKENAKYIFTDISTRDNSTLLSAGNFFLDLSFIIDELRVPLLESLDKLVGCWNSFFRLFPRVFFSVTIGRLPLSFFVVWTHYG